MALDTKLTKVVSGYLPPEKGPFECEHCIYFKSPHSCQLVAGSIDPEGCCNLYTPKDESKEDTEET